jgi:flagellar biosynthesis protein FlhF
LLSVSVRLFFLSAFFLLPSAFDFVKLICIVADSPTTALAEVHERLGPDAVIVAVRQLPAPGLARLWNKKGRIEVTAGVPDKTSAPQTGTPSPPRNFFENTANLVPDTDRWRSVAWLEAMGLLPAHAERLQTHLRAVQGDTPPALLDEEWKIVSAALSLFWLKPPPLDDRAGARPHVFIGPPGSGKTTALCKGLTLASLLEERAARVWRLDGGTANTAEFLVIHCEMLGVPLERFWSKPEAAGELWFVDLPGVAISDAAGLTALQSQLATLPSPRVHLVLNAAYEMPALLAQWHAFAPYGPEDLIFTHLDEETRRVKLWNFVFGTNCSLRFLGAGQKIPGEFRNATPEILLPAKSL